jgi:hypothetical protein
MIMLSVFKSISYGGMSKSCCHIFGLTVVASVWIISPAGGISQALMYPPRGQKALLARKKK